MDQPQDSPAPHGYLSEQDKRRFTTVAGVLGAVFLLVQFLAPMAAMFLIMPFGVLDAEMRTFDLEGAVIVEGKVYVVEKLLRGFADGESKSRLVRFDEDGRRDVAELDGRSPGLLADEGRLWLLSSDRVGALVDGDIEYRTDHEPLGDIGRPFLFRGAPAVAERRPDGDRVRRWDGTRWEELAVLPSRADGCPCDVLMAAGPNLLALTQTGQTVFFRPVTEAPEEALGWEPVATDVSSWNSFVWDGRPAVAIASSGGLRLLRYEEDRWRAREGPQLGGRHLELAVLQEQPGAPLRMLTQTIPGSLRERVWDGHAIVEDRRLERSTLFPWRMGFAPMLAAQLVPTSLSLLLAIILSSMMRTHRVGSHVFEGRRVAYASLTRRALAQVVDGTLAFAPLGVLGFLWLGPGMERFFEEGPSSVLWLFAWMAGGLLCAFLVLVGFSFTEGVWGGSPGKWLLGIRVFGTDLKPCGFGRALIRNLLKLVDGFFNFLVGILMVAFTPEWQRLGDLAARTIVIHPSRPPGGP